MRAVEPLLYQHKAAVVITGHVHGECAVTYPVGAMRSETCAMRRYVFTLREFPRPRRTPLLLVLFLESVSVGCVGA